MTLSNNIPEDLDAVMRAVSPFNLQARGAGLHEAAVEVLRRHGANADLDAVMAYALDAALRVSSFREGLAAEIVPFYGALFQWARLGYPHFSLTPDFFSAIALTDFGDPTDEPLYMPFDTFTMSFPPSEYLANASKLIVYRVPKALIRSDAGLTVVETLEWKLYRATLLVDAPMFTQWRIGMTRRELVQEATQLDAMVQNHQGVRPLDENEKHLPIRIRTLLANVMTYIETKGGLPKNARARKHPVPAPVERLFPDRPLFEVGRVVKLDGELRKALRESAGDVARWHVAKRFPVRGHWRNARVGPARELIKRIWIEPHMKGPENAVEALQRTYEVT